MTGLLDRLLRIRLPKPAPVVAPGVYAYTRDGDGEVSRLHLRADQSGDGVLVANAALAARLSAAGVFLAKQLLDGQPPDKIVPLLHKHFSAAKPDIVRSDIAQLQALIDGTDKHSNSYPVVTLGDSSFAGQPDVLEKPIVADVAVTDDSLEVLVRRLWEQGIMHTVFVLSAQYEAPALARLVELAEDLGMIAGVRGTATALAGGTLIDELAQAGVDHINVYYAAADQRLHDGLLGAGDHAKTHATFERLRDNEVCPVAEIPLLEENLPVVDTALVQLRELGVENVAFFALATDSPADADRHGALSPDDLLQTAATVEEIVELKGLMGTWYAPVLRDPSAGIGQQICNGPRASGDNAIRLMSDGAVYPARGPHRSAGNMLEQDWADIERGEVYAGFVGRVTTSTRCQSCPGLAICAADCPRARIGWSDDTEGRS